MRIQVGEPFTFNNERYCVARGFRESRKYIVKKFDRKYNGWVTRFKADTLREVIEVLEDSEVL